MFGLLNQLAFQLLFNKRLAVAKEYRLKQVIIIFQMVRFYFASTHLLPNDRLQLRRAISIQAERNKIT
jgi:hypothetical protein